MKSIQKKKYSILSKISTYSFIVILVFSITLPFFAYADPCNGKFDKTGQPLPYGCDPNETPAGANPNGNGNPAGANPNGGGIPAGANPKGGINISTGITNPIAGIEDIPSFIEAILNFVLIVGVPIITLAIIYCGFLFVSARGRAEELTKAKKALMYTLIGAALLLGSYVIAHAIKGTVDDIKSTT